MYGINAFKNGNHNITFQYKFTDQNWIFFNITCSIVHTDEEIEHDPLPEYRNTPNHRQQKDLDIKLYSRNVPSLF